LKGVNWSKVISSFCIYYLLIAVRVSYHDVWADVFFVYFN
jgi:hypothetical protein